MLNTLKNHQFYKLVIVTYCLFFIIPSNILSQNFNITLGGEGKESITQVIELKDGNLIGLGYTESLSPASAMVQNHGKQDIWFVRLDSIGNLIFNKLIGSEDQERSSSLFKLKENRFLLLSSTTTSVNPSNVSLMILDASGNIIKSKIIENTNVFFHNINKAISIDNNEFVFGGIVVYTDTWESFFGKIDSSLNVISYNVYNFVNSENHSIIDFDLLANDGFVGVGGKTIMGSPPNSFIIKLNSKGDEIWNKCLGNNISTTKVIAYDNDNFILAGSAKNETSESNDIISELTKGEQDFLILKMDSLGNVIWDKTIGSSENDNQVIDMMELRTGSILLLAATIGSDGDVPNNSYGKQDIWLVELDTTGNIQSNKIIGANEDDLPKGIIETKDSGFIIWATSNSSNSGDITETNRGKKDAWIVKLDADANIEWQRLIGGSEDDEIENIIQLANGGYVLCGTTYSSNSGDILTENQGESDAWIIKMDANGNFDTRVSTIDIPAKPQYQIYPNPFTDVLQIDLHLTEPTNLNVSVYDTNGQLVKVLANGIFGMGKQQFSWQNSSELKLLTKGNYWCNFNFTNNKLSSFSVPLQKQ